MKKLVSTSLIALVLLSAIVSFVPQAAQASSASYIQDRYITPNRTLISDFENVSQWTKGAYGNLTADTLHFKDGSQGLKLTALNTSVTQMDRAFTINMTQKSYTFWVYVDDATKLGSFSIYVANTTNFSSAFAYFQYSISRIMTGWNQLTIPYGVNASSGSDAWVGSGGFNAATWSQICVFRFRVTAVNDASTVSATFDSLYAFSNLRTKGVVTFTFDDGWSACYNTAEPMLEAYGYAATAFVITGSVGTANYMTLDQLKTLQTSGWDISSHTANHVLLTGETNATIENELAASKAYLIANGFTKGARFFANPYYTTNAIVQEYISKYYSMARPMDLRYCALTPANPYMVTNYATNNATTVSTVMSLINTANLNGAWLVLNMHLITDATPSQSSYMTTATFQAILDYCHLNNIDVETFSQVYDSMVTPPTIGTITPSGTTAGKAVHFSSSLSDIMNLSGYCFSWNNSGVWTSQPWQVITGNTYTATFEDTWTNHGGDTIQVKILVNNTEGSIVESAIQSFLLLPPETNGNPFPSTSDIFNLNSLAFGAVNANTTTVGEATFSFQTTGFTIISASISGEQSDLFTIVSSLPLTASGGSGKIKVLLTLPENTKPGDYTNTLTLNGRDAFGTSLAASAPVTFTVPEHNSTKVVNFDLHETKTQIIIGVVVVLIVAGILIGRSKHNK